MNRNTSLFTLFIIIIAVIAIFFTAQTAPGQQNSDSFFTPTASPTNSLATEITTTATLISTFDSMTGGLNCTYQRDDWLDTPEAWLFESIRIGPVNFSRDEAYSFLSSNSGDIVSVLKQQLLITVLNQRNGSDPTSILGTIADSISWLNIFENNADIPADQLDLAATYAQALSDFNSGITGPGLCTEPLTPRVTPTPSFTPTLEFTLTPTNTFTPSITPTRTQVRIVRTSPPSATSTPRPGNTNPPLPTNTPLPRPTDTPVPLPPTPTEAPTLILP